MGDMSNFNLPSGIVPVTANQISAFASGTIYSLTATPALLDFGTTDPSIVINSPGTYLIMGRCMLNYNAATFSAVRTATLKLRRTNNSGKDLDNGSTSIKSQIITALTFSMGDVSWQTIYATTNSDDIIQLFGSVDVIPTAGTLDASEASIIAIRLQQ